MKRVLAIFFLLAGSCPAAFAQEPYFCTTPGASLQYERRDADNGKLVWKHTLDVLSSSPSEDGAEIRCASRFTNERDREIAVVEYSTFIEDSGNVLTDLNSTVASAIKNFLPKADIEAGFSPTVLPSELTPGMALPDAFSSIKVMGSPFNISVTERSVVRYETLTTPAGTFECVVVTEHKQEKFFLYNRDTVSYTWYARGLGMIRHDTWKNGRPDTSEILNNLSGKMILSPDK